MKTLFLAAGLLLSAIAVKAQPVTVSNVTQCALTVQELCYDPNTCTYIPNGAPHVIPPGGGSFNQSSCNTLPYVYPAFEVCWQTTPPATGASCPLNNSTPCVIVSASTAVICGLTYGGLLTNYCPTCTPITGPDGGADVTYDPISRILKVYRRL